MNDRPTPETDAAIIKADGSWTQELKETMRKLERERDEAREKAEKSKAYKRVLKETNAQLKRERDKAREALREIAEAGGFDNIGNWARNKAKSAIYR